MKFLAATALFAIHNIPLAQGRPLSEYCPDAFRSQASILPYDEYRSAQLPCTVEYCKHHGRADSFPAATCVDVGGGEWVTRPDFADESASGGLSTEEKYLCTVASIADESSVKKTYLAKTARKRDNGFIDYLLAKTRNELDTSKFVQLDDDHLLFWLKLDGNEVTAISEEFVSIQPLISALKVSPEIYTADDDSDVRLTLDGEASADAIKDSLESICPSCSVEDTSSKYGKELLVKGATNAANLASQIVSHTSIEASLLSLTADAKRNFTNENAAWIIQSGNGTKLAPEDSHTPFWDHNIKGQGITVGVADSGLDHQSCYFYDANYPVTFPSQGDPLISNKKVFEQLSHRKVVQYVGFASENEGEDNGHGTHVCGSVMGKSSQSSGSPDDGMAYEAKVAFYDIGVPNAQYLNVPGNVYTQMLPYAKRVGANLHSNSWGSPNNVYTSDAMQMDAYSFDNQDFLVLVAAGNDGDGPGGQQVPGSLGAPATGKNVLSVGATNIYDTPQNGGDDIAMFSSRGPAFDGRFKPDVMAPGRFIKSAKSLTSPSNDHCSTTYMQGTSMATPVVAGAAALIQQYFREGYYPLGAKKAEDSMVPMGALVKAVLVNGAQRLTTPMANFQNNDYPNNDQGHGIVELDANMLFSDNPIDAGRGFFVRGDFADMPKFAAATDAPFVQTFKSTGVDCDKHSLRFSDTPFRATLVYHDYPASFNVQGTSLVNDLDIVVTGDDGSTHYPNGLSARDNKNNVESVNIVTPTAGVTYTVTVTPHTISNGPQPYSLVVSGCFWNPDVPVPDEGGGIGSIISGDNLALIGKIAGLGAAAVAGALLIIWGVKKYNNRSRVGRNYAKKKAPPAKRASRGISMGGRKSSANSRSSGHLSSAGFHGQGHQGVGSKYGQHKQSSARSVTPPKRGSVTKSYGKGGAKATAKTFNSKKWGSSNMV